jgi:hypothetical protein
VDPCLGPQIAAHLQDISSGLENRTTPTAVIQATRPGRLTAIEIGRW